MAGSANVTLAQLWWRDCDNACPCILSAVLGTVLQVDVRLGPASETLDRLAAEGRRFDLAFLDADKTGYLGYYEKVLPQSRHVLCCTALLLIQSRCASPVQGIATAHVSCS